MLPLRDRNIVSGQIATLDQSINQLEHVESRLWEELCGVRDKLANLRDQRAALESRIAAVWTLPNEILSYIFEIGSSEERDEASATVEEDDDGGVELPKFPILVSHVCRTFREVAISMPTLWSQIHIHDLELPRLDLVSTYVKRSVCSALDVMIECEEGRFDSDSKPIQFLMDILGPHLHRLQRLTVRLCGFQALFHVMQHLNQPAPQLEVLEISDIDYEHDFDESDVFRPVALRQPLTLFNGEIPALKGLSLDGVHVAWDKCNFTGLMDLHLGYHVLDVRPSYDEFKAIIDASPDLRSLHLRGSAPLISEDTTDSSLYLPLRMERLEDLHMSNISSDYASTLISLLNAPNLQSLSLTTLNSNDYSALLRRIIGPPQLFPMLTALKLADIEARDDAIEELLRTTSQVTHLGLYFNKMPSSWLNYLEPQDGEVLCPKLQCLRCISASAYDIRRILRKRQEAGFPIPTLQIDKDTEAWGQESTMKWLKENTAVEIIEPSEPDTDEDEEIDDTGSESGTDGQYDEGLGFGGFPYFSMEGFSDEEAEGEEDYEDESEMEVDTDVFGSDGAAEVGGPE